MPGQRLPMRQVREVLRLKHVCGHSGHQIAAMVGVSRYTADTVAAAKRLTLLLRRKSESPFSMHANTT